MRRISLLALILVAAVGSTASAQIDTRGKTQVGISGFGVIADNTGFMSAQFSLTKFVTKNLEVGGDLTTNVQHTGGGGDFGGESSTSTTGDVFGRVRYNFVGQSLTIPYLSFGAGTSLSSDDNGGSKPMEYQVGAGFKRFLNERVSFNGEANYTTIQISGAPSSSSINFLVGISIYTGR